MSKLCQKRTVWLSSVPVETAHSTHPMGLLPSEERYLTVYTFTVSFTGASYDNHFSHIARDPGLELNHETQTQLP
jgi:hypothetical protein